MTHVSRNYADQIAKDRGKIVDEIIRRDGPAPPTTTLTTRLRELMEEATNALEDQRRAEAANDGDAWQKAGYREIAALNERDLLIRNHAPTIIRLLEAVDEVSDDMLAAFNASVEASLPYVRMKYDNDTLRRAIAATLRAAREGAR